MPERPGADHLRAPRPQIGDRPLRASEFDERFDSGEDMSAHIDWTKTRRLNVEVRRVNVDFPT